MLKRNKVGIFVAHEDDVILGVGGIIIQHLEKQDDVYITVCTDGRNSHKAVLDIKENPTPAEVAETRRKEFNRATKILGCKRENIFYLNTEDGTVRNNADIVRKQIKEIITKINPDIIYFHYSDAHPDHRAVSEIIKNILNYMEPFPQAYQFFIWTKKLSKDRPEVDEKNIPEIPKDAIEVNIRSELETKRKALYEMRSQILTHPYKNWQIQSKPILDKNFVDYFLRGEEIILRLK